MHNMTIFAKQPSIDRIAKALTGKSFLELEGDVSLIVALMWVAYCDSRWN